MRKPHRTDIEMKNSGRWAKVSNKTYRHETGTTVAYDHNHFGWRIDGGSRIYRTLDQARYYAERNAR